MSSFILLTSKDPWLSPTGGTSSFAKQLLEIYKDDIAVVSMTHSNEIPIGKWIGRNFGNSQIKFLSIGEYSLKKTVVPARLNFLFCLFRFRKELSDLGIKNIFMDSPEAIFALTNDWKSLCYMFHGLNNPVKHGRYKLLQWLGSAFENYFLFRLKLLAPDCILAAADDNSIKEFDERTGFKKRIGAIHSFPTRVDDNIFFPIEETQALRKKLNLKEDIVLTVIGRLAQIKGWKLLLDAFNLFLERKPNSTLIFVGDGEDRNKIEKDIHLMGIENKVRISGFVSSHKVAEYINASDICLIGSIREGWSVSMCEILACGKGMVSTNVSGANNMIINGKNGYIVDQRNPRNYYKHIIKALDIPGKKEVSLELSKKYLLRTLKTDLEKLWFH